MTQENAQSFVNPVNPLVLPGSPMHLTGMFVYMLQQRFQEGVNKTPWPWSSDDNLTAIYIGSYLETGSHLETFYPRIVVTRGTKVSRRVSVGDLDPRQPEMMLGGTKYGIRHCDIDFRIQIFANNPGEAEVIGDIVFTTIDFSRDEILQEMTLRDIPIVTLQPVSVMPKGEEKYQCTVDFRTNFEVRYATVDAAARLKQVTISTQVQGGIDYAEHIIRRGSDLPSP